MASSAVRAHAQTGRGRGRGIPPSTRNSSSSSPPPAFRNPPPGLRDTASLSPSSPTPRNSPPAPRNSPSASRNSLSAPRPRPQDIIDREHRYTITQRVQCLTLLVEEFSGTDIEAKTEVKRSSQSHIKKRAYARGFRPEQDPRILEHYVQDGERSGRSKEISLETEQRLIDNVQKDRAGREKSSEVLAYECGISRSSALRILHKYKLTNVKPTRKPGLTRIMRAARLIFCLGHANWTLEDWKRVIWSDETSVILGQRRGSIRIWRNVGDIYENSCIRRRWKRFTEFMFWGCFCWDKKGSCHIWTKETSTERKEADKELEQLNIALEPALKVA